MRIEKVIDVSGNTSLVVVDRDMRIVPEILMFSNYMIYSKNLSPNTVSSYLHTLKVFYEWLEVENLPFWDVKSADIPKFQRFVDTRRDSAVSAATMNRTLAALASFYRYFEVTGGHITESPIKKVTGRKGKDAGRGFLHHAFQQSTIDVHYFKRRVRKRVRKRLFPHQAEAFYDKINDLANGTELEESIAYRDRLMFRILYETGMRIGELLHLRINDFDLPRLGETVGNLYLIDRHEQDLERQLKTGPRDIVVSRDLLYEVERYITEYRPYLGQVEYIFVRHKGSPAGERLSRKQVEARFRFVSKVCNISCTPHTLRHTHASNLADEGWDTLYIKERLGHADINTSAKYIHLSPVKKSEYYERYLREKDGDELK